jgi:hypothetical protein
VYRQATQASRPGYAWMVIAGVALVVLYSFARLSSVALLFINDSRMPAREFLKTLPAGASLEHTSYAPDIPREQFEREHNYPLYFLRNINDAPPTDKKFKYNAGEAGLDDRNTTYFITDSFTVNKFNNPYTCSIMQVECDFFKQLAGGKSDHYKLIAEYLYKPPAFLPQITVEYVNPKIRIYERTQ